MDVAFFPFDDQTCILKLGSWLHDGFSVSPIVNNLALTLDMNEKIQFHAILTINITYKSIMVM